MLKAKFRVNAVPGTEEDVKEVLAMACETLGTATVADIENTDKGMLLTVHIDAPDGSVQLFKRHISNHLKRFRDTQLTLLQEVLPEQTTFSERNEKP